MVYLASADCIGVEIINNRLYGGNGRSAAGKAKPEVLEGNKALPLAQAARPKPVVPSIYEWQKSQRGK